MCVLSWYCWPLKSANKNSFIGDSLPHIHLLPSHSLSVYWALFSSNVYVSLCQFILLAWGVIHCLHLSLFGLSFLSFGVSIPLSLLSSKIWHGIETGEHLLFFLTHSSFLKSNQLRWNQVITFAMFLLSPSCQFFYFCSRSMKFYTLNRSRGRPVSQMNGCELDLKRIEQKKSEIDIWQDFVCLCTYVCLSVSLQMLCFIPAPTSHMHIHTSSPIMCGGVDCLVWFVVVRFFFPSLPFIWGEK